MTARWLLAAGLVAALSACHGSTSDPAPPESTTVDTFALECRNDRIESVFNRFGAVSGPPTAQAALFEFFEVEGRGFSTLEPRGAGSDDLTFTFVDADESIQLIVRLTDEYDGYLVAEYSYCVDGSR